METATDVTWFSSPETTPKNTCPNELFVRFVADNYKPPATFVDIGSGSGANAAYLRSRGFRAITIDSSPQAAAVLTGDVCNAIKSIENADCIFDINCLCHVENPPYEAIYKALKPGGKFFSIHPADDTQINMAGKGYTRMADALTMRKLLGRGFNNFTCHRSTHWRGDIRETFWQIEATK